MPDVVGTLYKVALEFEGKDTGKVWDQLKRDLNRSGIDSALVSNIQRSTKGMAGTITTMMAQAITGGFDKADIGRLGKTLNDMNARLAKASQAVLDAQREAAALSEDADEATVKAAREKVKMAMQTAYQERSALEKRLKAERKIIDERHKAIAAAEEFQNKSLMGRVQQMKDMLSGAYQSAQGGDVGGFMEIMGQGKGLATGTAALGARGAGASGIGGRVAATGLASIAAHLAAIAGALAVVAGAVAVVVKVMMEAITQAKELNRSIIEVASAGDFMALRTGDSFAEVGEGLSSIREAATDFVLNVKWDTTHEDIMKIVGAANEAGLTFREMSTEFTSMTDAASAYTATADVALRFSQLLNVEAGELATTMAEWSDDFGMGLGQVEESLATITDLAMESGFGVKRFYSMVQQATTGVGQYNVRIEEAAKLLSETGKILGEQEAAEFVKEMTQGFATESYEDNLKRIMITGTDRMREIMGKDLSKTADSFADKFGESTKEFMKDEWEIEIGSGAGGGAALADKLSTMTEKDRKKLLAQLDRRDSTAAKELEHVVDLAAATSGKMSDVAQAMDDLSVASTIETSLAGIEEFFGKGLSDLSVSELMAAEQVTGMSKEQLEAMRLIEQRLAGQMEVMKAADGEAALMAAEMGLFVDEAGRIFSDEAMTKEITKSSELARHQTEKLGDVTSVMSRQEALAEAMVEHTRDLGNIVENGAVFFLERIYGLLFDFYHSWTGLSESEREGIAQALEKQEKRFEAVTSERASVEEKIEQIEQDIATGKALRPDKKGELAELRAEREHLVSQTEVIKGAMADLQGQGKTTADRFAEISTLGQYQMGGRTDIVGATLEQLGVLQGPDISGTAEWRASGAVAGDKQSLGGMTQADIEAGAAVRRKEYSAKGGAVVGAAMGLLTGGPGGFGAGKFAAGVFGYLGEQVGATEAVRDKLESTERIVEKQGNERQKTDKKTHGLLEDLPEDIQKARMRQEAASKILDAMKGDLTMKEVDALLRGGAAGAEVAGRVRGKLDAEGLRAVGTTLDLYTKGKVNDFIYRGGSRGGTITPINKADDLLGAKAGGPVDKALGGGRAGNVVININGGDTAKIYDTVKRAMQNSGVRPRPGGGRR